MTQLSVVVPAFNAVAHLPATLASCRANARPGTEFVVVDDGSTDGTPELVAAAADTLPGLRLVRSPENVGLASARNLGLAAADGRFLMFLDADDWLGRGYLQDLLGVARRSGVDFLRTDHVQVRGLRRTLHRAPVAHRDVALDARAHVLPATSTSMVDYPYAWAGLVDRSRVADAHLRFDPGLHTAEDRPWIWRLHRHAESFLVPDLVGYFYRREVSSSLTAALDRRQLDFTDAFTRVIRDLQRDREPEVFVEKAVRTVCAVLAHHLSRSAAMTDEVRAELRRRSALLLRQVPTALLHQVLSGFDPARRARVLSVLEPWPPVRVGGRAGRVPVGAARAAH